MFKLYNTTQDVIRGTRYLNKLFTEFGGTEFPNIIKRSIDNMVLMGDPLEALNLADEHYWSTEKRLVFPESIQLLYDAYNTKYENLNSISINFPFDSFNLAIPANTYIGGQKIVPCLITYMKYEDYQKQYLKDISSFATSFSLSQTSESNFNENYLCILYKNNEQATKNIRLMINDESIIKILNSKNIEEYNDILTNIKGSQTCNNLSEEEKLQQFVIAKVICGLSVYCAQNPDVISGIPLGKKIRYPKSSKSLDYNSFKIPYKQDSKNAVSVC